MRPLIAKRVLSWDALVERRERGVVMDADGITEDLDLLALQDALSKLISHPTDICECRFDFSGGEMKVKHQCAYHKGIADRLDAAEKALSEKRGFGDPVPFVEHHALQSKLKAAESRLGELQNAVSSLINGDPYDFAGKLQLEDALAASRVVEKL